MLKKLLNTHSLAGLALGIGLLSVAVLPRLPGAAPSASYIVQGRSLAEIRSAVQALGGEITHELGVIRAVGARLTSVQRHALERSGAVRRLYDNHRVETAKKPAKTKVPVVVEAPVATIDTASVATNGTLDSVATAAAETAHVSGVKAHTLHAEGITGAGVTLAVLDSGLSYYDQIKRGADDSLRALAQYDAIASFSSAGPTVEGFVKPDLVAPGGHLIGLMNDDGYIALAHPEFRDENGMYFTMSGTSQSAALILQADPTPSPDDVKCRLMASAKGARNADGSPRYSILQQGAGLVDAYAAVQSTALGCANRVLDIAQDLAGDEHYAGLVRRDADGNYYLETLEGQSMLWSDALTESVAVNVWVPQE